MKYLPPHVVSAIIRDDVHALKRMGRNGGRTTQRRKDERASADSLMREKWEHDLQQEQRARAEAANEHLVPLDDSPAGHLFFDDED